MVIVGLGNIGNTYESTHHNAGFMALDEIAKANNLVFRNETKFLGLVCEYYHNNQKHYLVKPTTYMNNSGFCVKKILDYYNLTDQDLLVIYDDLDLPLGDLRIRKCGSGGTHNGMKSIISNIGSNNFSRIRIGIKKQKEIDTVDYVLSKFSKQELLVINKTLNIIPNIIDDFLNNGIDYIMNNYNGSVK